MASKQMTYGDISEFLQVHGFLRTVIPHSHVLFEDAGRGASLMLPIERANTKARPAHVAMARRMLIDFGVLSEEDVENWLADFKRFQAA